MTKSSDEQRDNGLTAAAYEQPNRNKKKNDSENITGHFTPLWSCKERLQSARQQHDQAVHEGGDRDIDGNQDSQFAYRRRGAADELRNDGDKEQSGLRIEQVGDKSAAKMQEMRLADRRGLDRSPAFSPAVVSQPAKIQRAGPAKGFISQAIVQNQRSAAKPDCDAEKRQSQRHAEPAMRPLLAPSTARYAIFGPGVISMMRDVRTKAIRGD